MFLDGRESLGQTTESRFALVGDGFFRGWEAGRASRHQRAGTLLKKSTINCEAEKSCVLGPMRSVDRY